jgi:hypothetical protein
MAPPPLAHTKTWLSRTHYRRHFRLLTRPQRDLGYLERPTRHVDVLVATWRAVGWPRVGDLLATVGEVKRASANARPHLWVYISECKFCEHME